MRVILDTNIYISYLLVGREHRTITDIVETCLADDDIDLIVPQEMLEELSQTIQGKNYLRTHITNEDLNALLEVLRDTATIPLLLEDVAQLARDPEGDYLLAYSLMEEVDYLVTGDDDLLTLGVIDKLTIVNAPAFLPILDDRHT